MKMSDGSRLGQLLWDEDDLSGLHQGRMFWNQIKKKKKQRVRVGEKKRENESCQYSAGTFLNEGEKENKKKGGIEIGQRVWRRKTRRKKKTYGRNEMKEMRNNIKNKKF